MPATRDALLQLDRDVLLHVARYFGIAVSATATQWELLNELLTRRGASVGVSAARGFQFDDGATDETSLATETTPATESHAALATAALAPSTEVGRLGPHLPTATS